MKNPVLLVMSLLAGLGVITGAANLTDLLSPHAAGWLTLIVAAATATVQFWVRGQVTPLAAPRSEDGRLLVPLPERLPGPGE